MPARKSLSGRFAYAKKTGSTTDRSRYRATKRTTALAKKRKAAPRRSNVGASSWRVRMRQRPMSNTVINNIKGILNPHAASKPRLMDGATATSQSHQNKIVTDITIAADKTAVILLSPSLGVPLISMVDTGLTTTTPHNNSTADYHIDTTFLSATTPWAGNCSQKGDIAKWRVVSEGLKVKLLNTTSNNDGWFECFRVSKGCPVYQMELWEVVTATNDAFMRPKYDYLTGLEANVASSHERPSYFAGSIKDIDKYYFKLNPFAEEHPFVNNVHAFEITGTTTHSNASGTDVWKPSNADTQSYRPMWDAQYDDTHDQIAIIVHAGANGTKLLLDMAQNLEVVYDHDSTLSRYHQPTTQDKVAHSAAKKAATSVVAVTPQEAVETSTL